ncbi:nucleolar pre-ribosomal-associated protein 1, partial [Asbolus verrucosus]
MEEENDVKAAKKRPFSNDKNHVTASNKKVRLELFGKNFREQLKTEQKIQALQEFLRLINEEPKQDCIAAYLKQGGSTMEILQVMESDSTVSPILIFEVTNHILLQINARFPQYQNSAYDSCRYLLNTYVTLINKMIGLSSSMKERLVMLKLLTTVVTFSVVLAKDILLHVNFNPANLELLTKVNEKNEVRDAFIHFIMAFLVDDHFPTLSVLLEKKGLMTSIIKGLQFDKVDIVILVLTVMKGHILQNPSVSKTVKMKTFSTPVVKDIVNLYNWKGPGGIIDQKKKNKIVTVDEIDKSKVNEAVHAFLLVLCTSHKFGVIFKDYSMGLGKKHQNLLMFTVLESLERPWEHSYAGDLIIKICRACPDLTKTMWMNIKPFLEPRWTVKWLSAMKFAGQLLDEVQPECVEFCVNNLNVHQMSQVISFLVAPLPILKTIVPENHTYEKPAIKYNVLSLLLKMAKSVRNYLEKSKSWDNVDHELLTTSLSQHFNRNFPNIQFVLTDWDQSDEDLSNADYLETALDLLEEYRILAPKMLEEIEPILDVKDLLSKTEIIVNSSLLRKLQVKAVKFFMGLEPVLFGPKTELFEIVISFSLEFYYTSKDLTALHVLHDILKNSGIFDGFSIEIDLWIDVDPTAFKDVASKLQFLSSDLIRYTENWNNLEIVTLSKCKGNLLEDFQKFSIGFLENHLEIFDYDLYPNHKLNLLQTAIFYSTNLIKAETLRENHMENCKKFMAFLFSEKAFEDDRYIWAILGNPAILHNFTLFDSDDFTTKLVTDIVKGMDQCIAKDCITEFRQKIFSVISKVLKKPQKYTNARISVELLGTFGLDYQQCYKLNEKFVSLEDNKCFYRVACYCLDRMANLAKNDLNLQPLSNEVIKKLARFLAALINDQTPNVHNFSLAFLNYLKVFAHNLEGVEIELFDNLLSMTEFHKDNLLLCEFLLDRKPEFMLSFENNLDEICLKKSLLLKLLNVVIKQDSVTLLQKVFDRFENHIIKALLKPHKAGQHFQNHYESVGVLVEKFLKPDSFGAQIQKFETTELFHVYLLQIIYSKVEKNIKNLENMIMTFVHLLISLLKQKGGTKPVDNFVKICQVFVTFLHEIEKDKVDLTFLISNETFKTFCKLCLKYGVSGDVVLLKIMAQLVELCVGEEDGRLILDMFLSHSQFLDVVLGDSNKVELLNLWHVMCTKWPQFMERSHVPVLLSSYKATKGEADKIVLSLLKMYESKPDQTQFYDFKPFLWGRSAASHYSVRSDIQKALWRQPKMGDVLNSLHQPTIVATITNPSSPDSYDLEYFLPLFSHLLAPENPVHTYRFTKSGALALTITGLRGEKSERLAASHVLSRFYFHLEARQVGKDNLLWLRFVEAICKGMAVVDDFSLNSFVGIFLARMALVLTQPSDVMYVPLTQYLAAKDSLDFSTIPELYTFLHSSHVDFKEHKLFILEVLRDGLKCEKDFTTFLRSMGFKLISELCSSTVCDFPTKVLILDIFKCCCRIPLGVKVLCGNMSFLTQVFSLFTASCQKKERETGVILLKLLEILLQIVEVDENRRRNFLIYVNLITFVEDDQCFYYLTESKSLEMYYHILVII